MTVRLNQRPLLSAIAEVLPASLGRAGEIVARRVRAKLAIPAAGKGSRTSRTAAGRAAAKRKGSSSAPGEPPRRRSGDLRKSIAVEVISTAQEVRANVGSNLFYARYLERGTKKLKARPFLRPTLQEYRGQLPRTVGADIRRRLKAR